MGLAEEALGGGGAVGAVQMKVVHGREGGEFAISESVVAMLVQRQLTVAPLDTGAAALKQVGALVCDLLNERAGVGVERLNRMRRLTQRCE